MVDVNVWSDSRKICIWLIRPVTYTDSVFAIALTDESSDCATAIERKSVTARSRREREEVEVRCFMIRDRSMNSPRLSYTANSHTAPNLE